MVQWSKSAVRQLYKSLLLYGYKDLKYTDKDFYRRIIQNEFQKHKNISDPAERQYYLDKGNFFLQQKRGKLL